MIELHNAGECDCPVAFNHYVVTTKALPAIRKHGHFAAKPAQPPRRFIHCALCRHLVPCPHEDCHCPLGCKYAPDTLPATAPVVIPLEG